jgi:hypothetical protein
MPLKATFHGGHINYKEMFLWDSPRIGCGD